MVETKTVRGKDILDALKHNGFNHVRGQYFYYSEDDFDVTNKRQITGACALGQAALNLMVEPTELYAELNRVSNGFVGSTIIEANDSTTHICTQDNPNLTQCEDVFHSYPEIVDEAAKALAPYMESEFVLPVLDLDAIQAEIVRQ